jgi:hypothetical protein
VSKPGYDGVIDAARYHKGDLLWVRLYERRGAAFSDLLHIDRKALLQRLRAGKRYLTGRRITHMGSTFELGRRVQVLESEGRQVVTTSQDAARDILEDVPVI